MKGGSEEEESESFGSDPNPNYDEGEMVEMEIDAARALADMAVVGPAGSRESSALIFSPPVEDERNEKKEREIGTSSNQSMTFGRRGKQVLTEAEREAKRLRRVLANRESARQTILRRQALREELAKKVAVLSSENENVKLEKEKATNEYLSLKETNRQLKEELVKISMLESNPEVKQKTQIDSSLTRFSLILYNTPPMVPYMWGPWAQHTTDYIKNEPSTSQRGLPFSLSCYPPLYQINQETPSNAVKPTEEKQLLSTVDETDVSCSLTLGLETNTKPRNARTQIHKEEKAEVNTNCVKISDCTKAAIEARKRRKEITRLKQMQRRM